METVLRNNKMVLMEAAVVEQLRRKSGISLHPELVHAPLIYDELGRDTIIKLYRSYIDIAVDAKLPFLMCTPTWRTNKERVDNSDLPQNINSDSVKLMKEIRELYPENCNILIGGLIGCKNDCYLPEESLSTDDAELFHQWQIQELSDSGVDFLIAETIPSVKEASGIAQAMEKSGVPYVISFVINREGFVLDGTSLCEAINTIDSLTVIKPVGFMINCAYPTFLNRLNQPAEVFERLIGYLANASSLDHCDLDGSSNLEAEDTSLWGDEMLSLHKMGIKVLGGCCGTGVEHLRYLVK